ncbi:uncharacterized protein LOC113305744 [Papaver somniferum]|uniref:uncharacterized protein LOC113305744 n=1 Tax=Papaver somniferum TaxID=3469 RepID=UPI000E6F63C5|nr:uncharacterized protein LOC113305744 [Papaver somniferum]
MQQKMKAIEDVILPTDDNEAQGKSLWRNVSRLVLDVQNFTTSKMARVNKQAAMADMIHEGRWTGVFKHSLNVNENLGWDLLTRDLGVVPVLTDGEDQVQIMDKFSTKTCYEVLVGNMEDCTFSKLLWMNSIPPKVTFMLWDAFNHSLPTRGMLHHRGVEIPSSACVMYGAMDESADHLFLHCQTTFEVWDYFIKAFHISWPLSGTVLRLFQAWDNNILSGRCKEIWNIFHYALFWIIWEERNIRAFWGRNKSVYELIMHIKQTLVLWSCDKDTFKFIDSVQILHNWEAIIHM